MKKVITNSFYFIRKYLVLIVLFIGASFYLISQSNSVRFVADRDVIPGYQGWDGDPDSITVNIDTSAFTEAEQDSIRTAIGRWNAAGCTPALKETSDTPADVTITSRTFGGDTLGLCTNTIEPDGDVSSSTIELGEDTGDLSLSELTTHELGHAIGLDDTEESTNPSDAMKGTGPTNGTNGNLSAHDSTELAAANAAATTDAEEKNASMPAKALFPGEFGELWFDLGQVFPPDVIDQTDIFVSPIGDPYLYIEAVYILENYLHVALFSDPMHWSGKIYLEVDLLFPEPYPSMYFFGSHFINQFPADPVVFECPFDFNEDDGYTHINWVENCTYPLEHQLRSTLVIDGMYQVHQRWGGNYTLNLPPGPHTIELYVDDYQVNQTYYSMDILVTGIPEEKENTAVMAYPNPFSEFCWFECPDNTHITIYDISGSLISDLGSYTKQWKPSSDLPEGIYFIRFKGETHTKTMKIIYRK